MYRVQRGNVLRQPLQMPQITDVRLLRAIYTPGVIALQQTTGGQEVQLFPLTV